MKRKLCTLLILLSTLFAAPFADAQIKVGVKMGVNIANASINKEIFSSGNRLGFLIGPMVEVKLPVLGLGVNLAAQYNCKYAELTADEESGINSGVPCFHNIEIPLNIRWTIGSEDKFSVFAETGPQIAWNVGTQGFKQICDTDQYTIHSSQFSWNAGFGTTFLKKFRLGYTYNIAIGATADVDIKKDADDVISGKLRNNTHQIYFALFF